MSPSGDVNCCVVRTWGVWMQLAATPFSDGSIGARGFRAARLVRRLPGRGRTGGVTMMFRKLTLITALAATLAFPAVALAGHGGHGGHGGGGHGGGGLARRRRPWRLARRRRRLAWLAAVGMAAAGMAAAAGDDSGVVAGGLTALARAGGGITAPGLGFANDANWVCHRGMKSPGARARSARAHSTKSLPDSSSVDSSPSSQLGRRRRCRRVRNSRPDFWRDIADALPPRNRRMERERFPW